MRRGAKWLALLLTIGASAMSLWALLHDEGAPLFLCGAALALLLGWLAVREWRTPWEADSTSTSGTGSVQPPTLPVGWGAGDPDEIGPGAASGPLMTGDPATAERDLADLRAAVEVLGSCSPVERRRIEAANEPVGVEDIAEILQGPGIENYLEARDAWERGGRVGEAPGVDADLANAARDVLALVDRRTP